MKTSKMIIAAFAAIAMVSCSNNGGEGKEVSALSDSIQVEKPINPKSLLPSKAQKDSVSYFLGVNYGSMLKNYNFGDDLNYSLMVKGMKDFLAAKGDPRDSTFAKQFKMDPNTMNMVINDFLGKRHEYTLAVNAEKERKFLAENAAKEGVQVTESGLQYIIEEAGSELKPGPQDTVYVRYKGTLIDGTVFDETKEGQEAVRMLMNRVVKGWTEGLQLIGEGGKIKLFLPSALGYGERGNQGIEPNSALIFDVELESVKPYVEPVVEESKNNKKK